MKKSIYIRNFYMTTGIVFLSFIILGSMFFAWSYRLVISEKQQSMSSTAREMSKLVSALSADYELDGLAMRAVLTTFARTSGFDIILSDKGGLVISCSDWGVACSHIGRTVPGSVLSQMDSGMLFGKNTDLGGIYGEGRYILGIPIHYGGNQLVIGYLFLSSQSTDMIQLWRQFAGVFLMTAAAVLFLTFVISFITTKKQAEPLNEMAAAARRFARGDFSSRVENEDRVDEIGQLTDAFNSMADSLERSERLRRDFIANVSHELKTPMTVISGFSDGILDGTIPQSMERRYLEVISSETRRLSRLVANMLDMSRIQSTQPDELLRGSFDIAEVLRLALLSLGRKIEAKNLDVDAELPEEAIITRGDKDAITQVSYNLIDNAIKFAREGTPIRLCLWKQGPRVYVSVEDTGETIPPEEMPLIFDRFHKTDRSRSGTREGVGLGLYIVKTILDNHNEDIFVTSEEGVTKFTFTLTLAGPTQRPDR